MGHCRKNSHTLFVHYLSLVGPCAPFSKLQLYKHPKGEVCTQHQRLGVLTCSSTSEEDI